MRILSLCVAAAVFAPVCLAGSAWGSPPPMENLYEAQLVASGTNILDGQAIIGDVAAKLDAGDFADGIRQADTVIADPGFASLETGERFTIYLLRASCEGSVGTYQAAYDDLTMAGMIAPANRNFDYWSMLVDAAYALNKNGEAAEALTTVARSFPDRVGLMPIRFVNDIVNRAEKLDDSGMHRYQLLESLWEAKYVSPDPIETENSLWFDLFQMYVDRGETAKAKVVMTAITEPGVIIYMHIDKRFRPFVDAAKAETSHQFDFDPAVAAYVEKARVIAAAHPELLQPVINLVGLLSETGHQEEAIKLLEDARTKIAAAAPGAPPYSDIAAQRVTASLIYERVLYRSGRYDDAVAMKKAALDDALKAGSPAVDETINMAKTYIMGSEPQRGLDQLSSLDTAKLSPFGKMAVAATLTCAYVQLNDTTRLAEQVAYVRDHAGDSDGSFWTAMKCIGDVDGLARYIVQNLDDPDTRSGTLVELQTFVPEPYRTAMEQKMDGVVDAAKHRPEVTAAVAKYGYINSWSIMGE